MRGLEGMGAKELTHQLMFYGCVVKKAGQDVETLGSKDDTTVAPGLSFTQEEEERFDRLRGSLVTM